MESSRSPSVSPKRPASIDLRRLVGSVNQLRFNDNRGEVSFFGQKMIILRRDVIRVIREGLEKLVGEQATPFLSYLASGIGVHEGSIFRESTGSGNDKVAMMNNMVTSALEDTNLGLGKIRVLKANFDDGTANITISNCFEALENGKSEAPNCTFTSGFLAGMFAEVFDKTVQAVESKCMSQGQPECEFQISPVREEDVTEQPRVESGEDDATEVVKSSSTSVTSATPELDTDASSVSEKKKPIAGKDELEPQGAKGNATTQSEIDSGVETASRIEKRKGRFWKKLFQ